MEVGEGREWRGGVSLVVFICIHHHCITPTFPGQTYRGLPAM